MACSSRGSTSAMMSILAIRFTRRSASSVLFLVTSFRHVFKSSLRTRNFLASLSVFEWRLRFGPSLPQLCSTTLSQLGSSSQEEKHLKGEAPKSGPSDSKRMGQWSEKRRGRAMVETFGQVLIQFGLGDTRKRSRRMEFAPLGLTYVKLLPPRLSSLFSTTSRTVMCLKVCYVVAPTSPVPVLWLGYNENDIYCVVMELLRTQTAMYATAKNPRAISVMVAERLVDDDDDEPGGVLLAEDTGNLVLTLNPGNGFKRPIEPFKQKCGSNPQTLYEVFTCSLSSKSLSSSPSSPVNCKKFGPYNAAWREGWDEDCVPIQKEQFLHFSLSQICKMNLEI
ncbi:hypothetical protein LXL04_020107 [Taraxacum kok-saghyz]